MAGLITVRLSRSDSQPWGFRLQGGKDFGAPLLIQKVNGGSLAEKAGLQVADAVIKVNGQDVYNLRHKDAQDNIVRAGNSFEIVVSRSPGGTWKPAVSPVGNMPSPNLSGGAPSPVTKTSLAYKGPASPAIGTGHNTAARPFSATPQQNGMGDGNVKSITSKQYNNPVNLYSEQTIAETLSAQTEVLAGGVLGVNFMKNEKTYNSNNSEVLKMVQEIDSEPRQPEPEPMSPSVHMGGGGGGGMVAPAPVTGLRHVVPPENKPPSAAPQQQLQPGQNICADCERLIVGVFVRIKDKNLHVECFKCATCGTSLKNVGYYNINNKLYCDIHAKLVARSNPPAPNLDPVTIPPGGRIPSGVMSAPQPSLGGGAPHSPQPGTLAPLPFHAPRMKPSHVSAPRTYKPPTSNMSAPKPFGGMGSAPAPSHVSAPASAPFSPASAPFSPASAPFNPAPAPFNQAPAPPPPAAPFMSAPAPPSLSSFPKNLPDQVKDIEDMTCCKDKSKKMSICSSEVCDLSEKKSAIKTMAQLQEDSYRASPVPFSKGELRSEYFMSSDQEALKQSQNVESSQEGNVHITRKTKVEESFERSQKMYTAEISTSNSSVQVRASSPEMEQIMAKRRLHQAYDSPSPPNLTAMHPKLQSDRCLTPEIENIMDKPHGSWSPMPPACFVRPISPNQTVSFPPDIPSIPATLPRPPRTATPEQFQEARETVERFVDHTKQVHSSSTSSSKNMQQSYMQQSTQASLDQKYTPRFDASQGFSPYNVRGNSQNVNTNESTHGGGSGNYGDYSAGNSKNQSSGNTRDGGYYKNDDTPGNRRSEQAGNGNPRNNNGNTNNNGNGRSDNPGNGNPKKEKEPTVTEPDDSDSKSGQKSPRKQSYSEEESSRRVFSDFGGPQLSSSVDVESKTEGQTQTTSVKKTEKMQYSTCEFESSRTSSIKPRDDNSAVKSPDSGERKSTSAEESGKYSQTKFSEGGASTEEEEKMTKSQVEDIIKQELNKVFQMAQTMEKTNFGQMYDQKAQHASSEQSTEKSREHTAAKTLSQTQQKSTYSKMSSASDVITKTGKLTSGLTIAPARTFTPQALENNYPLPYQNLPSDVPLPRSNQQPVETSDKPAYIPITGDRGSPLLQALIIAPDRPYSPLPSATVPEPPSFITAPSRSSMLEALTVAPTTTFQIHGASSGNTVDQSKTTHSVTETRYESIQKYAPRPAKADFKPISEGAGQPLKSFPPVTDDLKSAFKSSTKVQSHIESGRQQSETTTVRALSVSRGERAMTPSGLHAPNLLPYYQREIGEIPLAHRSNSPVPHQIKAPSITPPRAQSVPRQGEKGSVKALSEAYTQQVVTQNGLQQPSSVSYVSAGASSKAESVTKTYSYEQEHKSIDKLSYQASPLAGKLPLAGEHTMPKCSSPVLGKLDHTKQVFKPSVPPQQPTSVFRSTLAEQANLRQAPPYFVQEKDKQTAPWVVIKESGDEEPTNISLIKPGPPTSLPRSTSQTTTKPLESSVNKTQPAIPPFPKPSSLPGLSKLPSALPDAGPGGPGGKSTMAGTSAPRRGRGVLNAAVTGGARVPLCGSCNNQIRGPFITALGKIWCPEHFVCVNANCRRPLQDIGFVEDVQGLYCEFCFEQYLAPTCNKCNAKVKGDCLNAIGKHFHPECFTCAYCGKLFGNSPFFLEDALPYCEADWNELFTTKCFSCGFPIEAGDRWVEALNNNYHSQCFNCTMCKKNLEGQSFFAKGGRPFCKTHAR